MTRYHRGQVIHYDRWYKLAPLTFAAAIGMNLIVKHLRRDRALDKLADLIRESRHVSLRESAAQQAAENKPLRP